MAVKSPFVDSVFRSAFWGSSDLLHDLLVPLTAVGAGGAVRGLTRQGIRNAVKYPAAVLDIELVLLQFEAPSSEVSGRRLELS